MELVHEDTLPLAEVKEILAIVGMRPYTRKDLRRFFIKLSHDGNLKASLSQIALIDASGIDPYVLGCALLLRSEPLLHDIFAILPHYHGLPIYGNRNCQGRITPSI
jgi:hypothetical protein